MPRSDCRGVTLAAAYLLLGRGGGGETSNTEPHLSVCQPLPLLLLLLRARLEGGARTLITVVQCQWRLLDAASGRRSPSGASTLLNCPGSSQQFAFSHCVRIQLAPQQHTSRGHPGMNQSVLAPDPPSRFQSCVARAQAQVQAEAEAEAGSVVGHVVGHINTTQQPNNQSRRACMWLAVPDQIVCAVILSQIRITVTAWHSIRRSRAVAYYNLRIDVI